MFTLFANKSIDFCVFVSSVQIQHNTPIQLSTVDYYCAKFEQENTESMKINKKREELN